MLKQQCVYSGNTWQGVLFPQLEPFCVFSFLPTYCVWTMHVNSGFVLCVCAQLHLYAADFSLTAVVVTVLSQAHQSTLCKFALSVGEWECWLRIKGFVWCVRFHRAVRLNFVSPPQCAIVLILQLHCRKSSNDSRSCRQILLTHVCWSRSVQTGPALSPTLRLECLVAMVLRESCFGCVTGWWLRGFSWPLEWADCGFTATGSHVY